ncbi:MAG: Fe-S cluster assembly protein SufD, partial [Pseudomonadota bacterium]
SVPVLDGHVFTELAENAPEGVTLSRSERVLTSDIPNENTIGLMGQALGGDCLDITVSDGASVDTPIGIGHLASDQAQLATSQHDVHIGAKASATIIERYTGSDGTAYHNTAVTNLSVGPGADAKYLIVFQNGDAATHLGQINVSIAADAKLTLFAVNAGGRFCRQDLNVKVAGEGSEFILRGVNLIGDDQHIDLTMDLNHAVPHTTSEEIIRNVVVGNGKGVFQGMIRVAQIAQKTDAQMACNTLLLSDDGDFSAKPELEIFADDVACGHGATFADIEPSYMFYLMSRGIPEREARAILIKGFVDEIVEDLDDEALEEAMVAIIDAWLDDHA